MSTPATLSAKAKGSCAVTGVLTLESAPELWKQLKATGLLRSAREVDLTGVSDADSAGLALLVAWRAHCLASGGTLDFQGLPSRIQALARLTSAQAALGA